MKKNLILFFAGLGLTCLLGQNAKAQTLDNQDVLHPSLGIKLGTQGIGLEYGINAGQRLNFRIGGNYVPPINFKYRGNDFKLERSNVVFNIDLFPLGGLEGDWFEKRFFITGGIAYYFQNAIDKIEPTPYNLAFTEWAPYIGTGLPVIY